MDWLCRKSKTLSIFDGAERAKGELDPLLVVPADVEINFFDELLDRGGLPVPRVEQFRFQPAEEAFARGVIRRAPLARHRANQLRVADPR
ncbi:hypothetical protein D9M72_344800 [compost metagenome]